MISFYDASGDKHPLTGYEEFCITHKQDGCDIKVEHRIVEYSEWPDENTRNTVTLSCVPDTIQGTIKGAIKSAVSSASEEADRKVENAQNIQQGDTNEDVKTWQALLYCLGYDPVGMDGSFGENTTKATEKIQEKLGLHPTGVVDAYTWAKALGYSRPSHTILRKGRHGAEVKYLQRLLSKKGYVVATDGAFGEETEAALIEFQKDTFPDQESEWDGECGPNTWAKIE